MGSLEELKKDVNIRISDNLKYLMKIQGYNQNELREAFLEHGVEINQGTINKYLNKPNNNFIPVAVLLKCCEIFNVSLNELVEKNLFDDDEKHCNLEIKYLKKSISDYIGEHDNELVMDLSNRVFRGYKGQYFCYLYPTISSEKNILTGTMTIAPDGCPNEVTMRLKVVKENRAEKKIIYKEYSGLLIMSKPMHNCYCILKSDKLSELCFLIFRHIYLNDAPLDCRMAEVLTVSAGESNYPTVHRMFFSRQEILEEDLKLVLPMLNLNCSEILISEKEIEDLKKEESIPTNVLEQLCNRVESKQFYLLTENVFRSILELNLPKSEKKNIPKYISLLRDKALHYRYNKVSKKLDDNIRKMLISKDYYQ